MTVNERLTVIKNFNLCSSCFTSKHKSQACRRKQICGINNCTKFHNRFLHPRNNENLEFEDENGNQLLNCTIPTENILFKIIPIKLYNNGKVVNSYALLDEGANVSLIENSLVEELGIHTDNIPENSLSIKWYGKQLTNEKSKNVSLEISGQFPNANQYVIDNIRTVSTLELPIQSIDTNKLPCQYNSFKGLPIKYSKAKPKIWLGLAHSSLGFSTIAEDNNGLIATKTKLGWTIHGSIKHDFQNDNHLTCLHINSSDENLESIVKNYFNTDQLGMQNTNDDEINEETRAKYILETTTNKTPGQNRFKTGLLWKSDNLILPNNFSLVLSRLQSIEKRVMQDIEFAKKYEEN